MSFLHKEKGNEIVLLTKKTITGIAETATVCAVSLLLASCGGNKGGGARFSMPPMPVEVAAARVQKVEDRFDAVGTIDALEAVTVVSEIDAAVTELPFQEGTLTKKGDVIAHLDDSQLAAELARAEALRAQSQTSYDRVKEIVSQKAGAPQDLDDAAAALKVADANLAVARSRLAKTHIVAPFDGMIGARRVSVGTFLRAGQAITDLANIDEIRVNFSAPEQVLPQLNRGAEVDISSTVVSGTLLKGRIVAIEPILDAGTRSARVVAQVANHGRAFRPGMSANVSAVLSERPKAITIPSEAVFASGNQSFVFVVKPDSSVSRTPVVLGTRTAEEVEIVQGLTAGTTVVRAGHQKLFDGAKVIPVPAQSGTASEHQ